MNCCTMRNNLPSILRRAMLHVFFLKICWEYMSKVLGLRSPCMQMYVRTVTAFAWCCGTPLSQSTGYVRKPTYSRSVKHEYTVDVHTEQTACWIAMAVALLQSTAVLLNDEPACRLCCVYCIGFVGCIRISPRRCNSQGYRVP
jgi:hypothetical protein